MPASAIRAVGIAVPCGLALPRPLKGPDSGSSGDDEEDDDGDDEGDHFIPSEAMTLTNSSNILEQSLTAVS